MKLKTFFLCCIFVGASTVSGQVDDFVTGCLATDVKLPCAQDYNINNIGGSVTRILWNIEKSPSELILQYTISSSTLQYAASYAGTTKYEFDAADYSLVLKNTASNDSDFLYTCSTLGSHSYVVNITLETCTTTATPVECDDCVACLVLFILASVFCGPIFGLGPSAHWRRRKYGNSDKCFQGLFISYIICGSLSAIFAMAVAGMCFDTADCSNGEKGKYCNQGKTAIGWPMAAALVHMAIYIPVIFMCPKKVPGKDCCS